MSIIEYFRKERKHRIQLAIAAYNSGDEKLADYHRLIAQYCYIAWRRLASEDANYD